ncbi:telomerase-binding protein EST1A isoform X1 [Oncorhynchus kisutch]|uniref:Telomerase-binding protein EST1A n=1 Tax=Oncorhynchus kisutch TaxID=8019 RepID=A0A8C7N1W1_ONCKI|nr:telomerase-binding protein EST1A isoform X1 [Oncorhynchus kisutch]
MADELDLSELDRVRISAAELRVEPSSFVNHGDVHREEQGEEGRGECQQQSNHGNDASKKSDLQYYMSEAIHGNRHHDSKEGEELTSPRHPVTMTSDPEEELVMSPPPQEEEEGHKMMVSTEPGCTDGEMGTEGEDKYGGGGSHGRGGFTFNREGSRASAQQRTQRGDHHTNRVDNNNSSSAGGPSCSGNGPQSSIQSDGGREKDQRDGGREKDQRDGGREKDQRDGGREKDQRDGGREKDQRDGGREKDQRDGGREKDQRDGGREKDQRDGGREKDQRDGGREKDQRDGGREKDQRDGGREKDQRDGGREKDQRDGGREKDQRDGGRENDQRDGGRENDQRDGGRENDQRDGGRETDHSGRDPDLPEPAGGSPGSAKPTRKTRKPDREIYQPGGRRSTTSTQGKEVGRETKKPNTPGSGSVREEAVVRREPAPQKETGGERGGGEEKGRGGRCEEKERRQGRRETGKAAAAVSDPVSENLTGKIEKLSVTVPAGREEEDERGGGEKGEGQEVDRRKKASVEGRRSRGVEGGGEKTEEKKRERGNRRNRGGGGGEKGGNQDSKRRGRGEGGGGKGERVIKERNKRESEGDKEGEANRPADTQPTKGREKQRDKETEREEPRDREMERGNNRPQDIDREREEPRDRDKQRGNNRPRDIDREREEPRDREMERDKQRGNNRPRDIDREREEPRDREMERDKQRGNNRPRDIDRERDGEMERNRERPAEGNERSRANTSPNNNHHHPSSSSKRYSKSDIRRPRNRTYSTSSASSGTSLDGPGLGKGGGLGEDRARRDRLGRRERERGEGGGGQLQNRRRSTRDSSTDSLEDSKVGEWMDERRRDGGEEDWSPERRKRVEESRGTGGRHRGGGRGGLLRISHSDRQSGSSQATSGPGEDPQGRRRQGTGPRSRGRGILILPAHTNLSNLPAEPGPRLLFGGIRGGRDAGLGRGGGRGGGTRRLWDPNNPDQKPALGLSQHASLQQQPMYLQTGVGYGALHFLDTDDEAAGSPPVRQGEHLHLQQQAAARAQAFYKYQNSDNPYPYNANPNPNTRYPYPYHTMPAGPYQIPPSNDMYHPGQFYGGYRGQGYPDGPEALAGGGSGAGVTPEEAGQHARGELGRLLRAADSQELQLTNLLSRDRLSADGLDRMAQLRADLLTLYERVILTDIEFSDSQNLDQALWKNVFYQVIERFRQLLKDPSGDSAPRITTMLLTLLDEGAVFFDALLQKLQMVFQFKLEDYMDGMAIRPRPLRKTVRYALISAQRCLICQGDIARYREQASDSANYGKARSWYLKAQQIAPKNGRPYNQLALLAVYTKRKLDAVYYYMRSLAASNPILTAKESLMSLFEEAKRKADQMGRRQESEGGSRGPGVQGAGRGRGEPGARVEIWLRPVVQAGALSSHRGGSESSRDSEQDGELGNLSASDLNKRFILSFLHAHGKLFTKVGMESFPEVVSRVLQEFRVLIQHSPSPLGSTRMLQIITINMFTIHNAQSRGGDGEVRSVLQEQTTALGLAMFSLLVQRCTELLRDTPAESIPEEEREDGDEWEEGMVRVSAFPLDLRELLPSVKVWSDWMLGHPDQWNPPPCSIDGCSSGVWRSLADLCNALARVDHGEAPLYKADGDGGEGDEELRLLLLEEDRLLAGFVPLLAAPQEPCYIELTRDTAIAADCKRVTVLKYFLEALCGQEQPLLAFKGGKYVSMATSPQPSSPGDAHSRHDSLTERESDDVIVEAESSVSEGDEGGGSEDDIRELRARRSALTNRLAQQQRRRDKIQAVLQTCGQLELEVRPLFLVPDTNGFIDHLTGLKTLLQSGTYILVVPLIVITELDGLAKGQESCGGSGGGHGGGGSRGNPGATHARAVQEKAKVAVAFLERGFEARDPCLRALTSRGSQLESIAFRSEDTSGQQGNNDDVILSCCLHYCKDKAKDFMPAKRDGPVRLRREVVLLTDDRNLRVKALTRNVPVRDIPAFLTWAKVG